MDIDELRLRSQTLRAKAAIERKKLDHVRNLYYMIEGKYLKLKHEYENVDRELAMLDGRLKVQIGHSGEKAPVLTLEQILSIAKKLGINIEED